jgi:hypothetical protein
MPDDDVTKTDNVRIDVAGERERQREGRMDVLAHDADEIRRSQQAGEKWYRTRKDMTDQQRTFIEQLKEGTKEILAEVAAMGSLTGTLKEVQGHTQQYIRSLGQLTSVSTIYKNTLEDMRKGQVAFTGSIQATTDSIGTASQKSQDYINGVRESYGNARKLAGEFKMETAAIEQATDQLNQKFASQIQAMGSVEGGLKGMQRDAVIFSRYMGTEMSDVIEMWGERLEQTNKTMKEVQNETALLAGESDAYGKALQKLGKRMLRTGHIGKKQFLSMIREVGKEMKTGTFNAVAYSKALRGLLIQAKKTHRTQQEQARSAQALKEITTGFGEGESPFAIFGFRAASSILDRIDDLSWVKDEQTRARLAQVREETAGEGQYTTLETIRNALQGTPELMKESFRAMRETGMDQATMAAIIANQTGANMWQARPVAAAIRGGDFETAMEEVQKIETEQQDQRAEKLRTSVDELVKQGAKPIEMQYKIADTLEKIKGVVEGWIRANPIKAIVIRMAASAAAQVAQTLVIRHAISMNTAQIVTAIRTSGGPGGGGGLPLPGGPRGKAGKMGRFGRFMRGGGMLGGLAQMGGSVALGMAMPHLLGLGDASPGTKGTVGMLGGMGSMFLPPGAQLALAGGLAAGHYGFEKGLGAALYSKEDERVLGGDKTLSAQFSKWAMSDKEQAETTRIRGGEYKRRLDRIKEIDGEIEAMKKNRVLSKKERKFRIKRMREEKKNLKGSIKRRVSRERAEVKEKKWKEIASRPGKIRESFDPAFMTSALRHGASAQDIFGNVMQRGRFTYRDLGSAGFYDKMMGRAGETMSGERLQEFSKILKRRIMVQTMAVGQRNVFEGMDTRALGMGKLGSMWKKMFPGRAIPGGEVSQPPAAVAAAGGAPQGIEVAVVGAGGEGETTYINARGERQTETQAVVTIKSTQNADTRNSQNEARKASKLQGGTFVA